MRFWGPENECCAAVIPSVGYVRVSPLIGLDALQKRGIGPWLPVRAAIPRVRVGVVYATVEEHAWPRYAYFKFFATLRGVWAVYSAVPP